MDCQSSPLLKPPLALLQQPTLPAAASEALPRCQPESYAAPRLHPLLVAMAVVDPPMERGGWEEMPLLMLMRHLLQAAQEW